MGMANIIAGLLLAFLSVFAGATTNKDVQRTIDATTAILKIYADIKVINCEKEYIVAFPSSQAKNLAFLSVTSKGKSLNIKDPYRNENVTKYSVFVGEASPTLKLEAIFTGLFEPYPAEITQSENQLVLLSQSHYFLSPYKTENQKTTVKLASSGIESFTKLTPHNVRGSVITFGPYKNVGPFVFSPVVIHFVHNKPFAKFSTIAREIEVSHWGNIAVEEVYELKHTGAKLQGGFSRFDYQTKRAVSSPSFRSLVAKLPLEANNIYYRDQIGNISTSDLLVGNDKLEMVIESRFPLFGGWQTQFYIGYSLPTEVGLYVDSSTGRHNLKFDFFTIFEDVWIEDLEIKVILPEGVNDIKVDCPYIVEQSTTKRFTYLDTQMNGGRTVLILRANNIVKKHDKQVTVSYKFNSSRIYVEPLLLVASFFVFFLICIVVSRLDSTIIVRETASNPTAATESTAGPEGKKNN